MDRINVCQYLKIAPLVLAMSACTSGTDSASTAPESSVNGVSDTLSTDGTTVIPGTNTTPGGLSTGNASSSLSMDEISALSASVGGMGTTDQTVNDQSTINQPNVVQPNEVTPTVNTPAITAPIITTPVIDTTTTNNGAGTSSEADALASTDNNPIVRIPRTDRDNAPTIDGAPLDYIAGTELLDGEWRFAAQFNGVNEPLEIGQYMFGEPGTNDVSANHHWAAVHDGIYLYVLVVSDDAGKHFQDTNELRKPWKDDSVELFIDGNNSRLDTYDGVDDFHMTINLLSSIGVSNASYIADPKIRQSDTSATLPADLAFAAGPGNGPAAASAERGRKDIYEIRIKLSELNIEVNAPFGIEVQINDDDNGGSRDAKWAWYHPAGNTSDNDFTWQNPSVMGTAILLQ